MFDTLIQNATVVSGRREAARQLDIGLKNSKIAAIEAQLPAENAARVIDATGCLLTPGFIDPHASTGFGFFFPQAADHKLLQGITTEIFGNCGTSPAPIGAGLVDTLQQLAGEIGFPFEWRDLGTYFEQIEPNLQFNVGTLIGHSTLRGGYLQDPSAVEPDDLDAMCDALSQALDEGALGLSTGLIYAPGCFAEIDELVALAQLTAKKGGVYASHIRNERDRLEDAVTEALTIADRAELPVLVSHLKAAERPNWGKIPAVLEQLETYNATHDDTARVDVYPYDAISTKLRAFIPKYLLKQGIDALPRLVAKQSAVEDIAVHIAQKDYDLDRMRIISEKIPAFAGKSVRRISEEEGQSPADTIAHILRTNPNSWIVYHCIHPDDIDAALTWPKAMVCTDSWSYPINAPRTIGRPHPRSYGAFTEYLEKFVLHRPLLEWPEAVHKVTQMPADFFGLRQRGQVKVGYFADLVLFRPENIKANATYETPTQYSEGIEKLWVNGKLTVEKGAVLPGVQAGEVLRR